MTQPTELYRKHRPTRFADMVGQPEAVTVLAEMVKNHRVPHALMFTGASGCGKTTAARILRKRLGCDDTYDFFEVNAAKDRGIEKIREISGQVGRYPIGKARMWLIDEAHNLTKQSGGDAQTALLKILEDTSEFDYFVLCTTHPDGLLKTIRTRCTEIKFRSLTESELVELMNAVLEKESKEITETVTQRIADVSEGSARKALVLLNQVMNLEEAEALETLAPSQTTKVAFDLVKALLWQNAKWPDIAKIIDGIQDTDWEGLRRLILANATGTLLKGSGNVARAATVLDCFEGNWFDSGKAGLVLACYKVFNDK